MCKAPQSDRASPRQYLRGLLGFADLGHIHNQLGFLDMCKYVSVWQRGLILSCFQVRRKARPVSLLRIMSTVTTSFLPSNRRPRWRWKCNRPFNMRCGDLGDCSFLFSHPYRACPPRRVERKCSPLSSPYLDLGAHSRSFFPFQRLNICTVFASRA